MGMKPQSFDEATCREIVGDARARVLEAEGRAWADAGAAAPPPPTTGTYWDQVRQEAEHRVRLAAYEKRRARLQRMAAA